MADDNDESPFIFSTVKNLEFKWPSNDPKKPKLQVSVGIYKASSSVERLAGEDQWKEIVYAQKYKKFLTLHALQERLEDPERREEDYTALKNNDGAMPFELWDGDGTFGALPPRLVPTNKPYDAKADEAQLRRWIDVAKNLGGKPSDNVNPKYARFLLRPSEDLKKKAGKELIYCTPAKSPAFGVTTDKLKAVIAANTGKFNSWPDPVVVDYATAEGMGLKLVGRNFLQFYFVWMKVEHYEALWNEFGVDKLLHDFPDDEKLYKDIDEKTLKGRRTGQAVDRAVTEISSKTLGATEERKTTQSIMGASATTVAGKLWGDNSFSSGMGKSVKVEWLHRVAFALGGQDSFNNLVFGTWECNTDMIRAENMVTDLTKKSAKGAEYKGKLTTKNETGTISRFTLANANMDETVPIWAKNYSWLCFSVNYRYVMDADKCPLNGGVAHDVDFDTWSIYVPLSIEPRLDIMVLNALKSGNTTTNATVMAHRNEKHSLASNMMGVFRALPILPLAGYSSREYAKLAWEAATQGLPLLELPGIIIKHPKIASPPSGENDTNDPESGFVLHGEIDVFGTGVVGTLEKWMGPAPPDVDVGDDPPSIERVVVAGDFHMSMLIPLLEGTPFDNIIFRNVAIYHQNYAFDKTKSIGWHFNADWVIDSSCGLLYDVLTTVLQVDQPTLGIHASFGEGLGWNTSLDLQSFTLEGIFSNLILSPVSGLTLTSIGVRLLGIRGFSFVPEPHSTLSFGYSVFGTMNLDVPGSIVPLDLDFEMGVVESTVNLRAELSGSIWEDALGVKGLLLEDVVFGTTFSASSPWSSFAFDVSATFSYLTSEAYLQGSYAAGGFSLTAEVDNFGTEEIDGVFFAIFSDFLTLPDFDVHVGSAIITIVSGQGLSISLNDVEVAGYAAVSVALALSSSGISLSGALTSSTITFGDVEVRDALLQLSFWSTGKEKNVDLMLGGTLGVDFLDLAVTAAAHLYPGEDGVEWAVVAELSAPSRAFSLSDIVPVVKDSFVDFSLSSAVLIAASQDDPSISQSYPQYDVRQGMHVFGVIERIPPLNDLLQEDVIGLVLNAGWSKASGFDLLVSLPAESPINLGNGIRTTPITLRIRTSPVELAISAGVTVPVQDSTPLDFTFVLAANVLDASASAQMDGWWMKPFGIDNLKIGPEVTLSIEIVYAQFVTTGTPSGFGVSGGLMIGNIKAFLAINISEDPERQLLYGELDKLDISDVVTFAGTLVGQDIPQIPDGLLKFEVLKLYICPSGVVMGTTSYPQGFSFKADLLLFEKRANIECTIDKAEKSVDIVGGIDNFELGPLTVRGSDGPRATLECHVGVSKQQLAVDGVITLFDMQSQTSIDIQFLPDPKFKFYSKLQFTNLFAFTLDAELLGSIHDQLSDADFSLYAEFENHLLEYIAEQIIAQFDAANVVATEGLEAAQEKVNEAKKAWEDAIADAKTKVEAAQRVWESYEQDIRSSSQPVIDDYISKISQLQGTIDEARKDYNDAMNAAEKAVDQANEARGSAMADAQRAVDQAKQGMDSAIDDAQRQLDYAEEDMEDAFGDAQRAIDDAQQQVWSLQNQIDDIEETINEYNDAPWYEFWKKAAIPGLYAAVGVLYASKGVASGVLDVARAVLTSSEYLAKEAVIQAARNTLELARVSGKETLSIAQTALAEADGLTQGAVDVAKTMLEEVKNGAEWYAFQIALDALERFKVLNQATYEAAMTAIEGLMDSVEFIAFNAAKAGLEVAEGSTAVLDAARDALILAEKASQTALSVLEKVVEFGAKALNIETIILSGTLRGIVGNGGSNSRPFSAIIKGYVVGQWFNVEAELDLREPVDFITAIFTKLWDIISNVLNFTVTAASESPVAAKRETIDDVIHQMTPGPLKSRLLQQGSDILKMLTDASESISMDIPRGPFSNRPAVSSLVVARMALDLMQAARRTPAFGDLDLGGM